MSPRGLNGRKNSKKIGFIQNRIYPVGIAVSLSFFEI